MSAGEPFQPQLGNSKVTSERNWLPLILAVVAVVFVVAAVLVFGGRSRVNAPAAVNAQPDAYASSLPFTGMKMSEAAIMTGGKVTYLDGHITNTGQKIVTGITVQVIFRSFTKEVAQNETQPLTFIRTREPYIDTEPVSAAPLKPGAGQDFRLIFDHVSPEWDGGYPEVRILRVQAR